MIIDQHLTWNDHINYVANKSAKTTGIPNKTRNFLKIDTLTTLYNTLIYPYLYYGNTVWANNYLSKLKKILKIQKRAVRIITLSSYNAKSAPLFRKTKLLKIVQLNKLCNRLFMYDYTKGNLPTFFDNYFTLNSTIHKHNIYTKYKFDP